MGDEVSVALASVSKSLTLLLAFARAINRVYKKRFFIYFFGHTTVNVPPAHYILLQKKNYILQIHLGGKSMYFGGLERFYDMLTFVGGI